MSENEKKFSVDEILKNNKKTIGLVGILATIFVYGPKACLSYVGDLISLIGERFVSFLENVLAVALNITADLRPILSGWLRCLALICRKWLIRSIIVAIVFLALITLGVAFECGVWIALIGIVAGLYFLLISFVIENSLVALGMAFSLSEAAIKALAKLPKAVLRKLGLELGSDGKPVVDRAALRQKLKEVRFLAVPFTALAFWLALFPCWRFYGFMFIALVGALSLSIISIWKEWDSRIWQKYHFVSKWVLLGAMGCFVVQSALPGAWNGVGKFLRTKEEAAMNYLNASPTPKAEGTSPLTLKEEKKPAPVVAAPSAVPNAMKKPVEPPKVIALPRVERQAETVLPSPPVVRSGEDDNDLLAQAALAGQQAKVQALKEFDETERRASGQSPVEAGKAEAKKLTTLKPKVSLNSSSSSQRGRVKVIRIPKWVQ